MDVDTITLLVAIIGSSIVGVRRELGDVRRDVADLRERMARLEGLFECFTRREAGTAAD